MTLLGEVVAASAEVAATRSRKAKTATLATLLAGLAARRGPARDGLARGRDAAGPHGHRLAHAAGRCRRRPRRNPTLTVGDVDAALDRLAAMAGSGTGVGARRAAELGGAARRGDAGRGPFLVRLLGGELRQGALEGS